MANCEKLIARARAPSANLRFAEALTLAECLGFEHARTHNSHHVFKRAGYVQTVNLQPDRRDPSKTNERQVEEMLRIYEQNGLEEDV